MIGQLYREGQLYMQESGVEVFEHDWKSLATEVVIPHGLYDLALNIGYVHIGTSGDTSEFAMHYCPKISAILAVPSLHFFAVWETFSMASRSRLPKSTVSESTKTPTRNPVQTRPFAPQLEPTPEPTLADMQAKLDHAQRFRHSLAHVTTTQPQTASPPIQPKLSIGAPGDKYEQEADHIAQQVVQRLNAPQMESSLAQSLVQRETLPNEDELQMKPLAHHIQRVKLPQTPDLSMNPMVQMQGGRAVAASQALESALQSSRGSGQSLAESIRQPLEHAFGNVDFSGVNVHTDTQADRLNRSIQARAFTTGQDIYFRQGAYQPGSRSGQELIAHELTHVVQQNGRPPDEVQMEPQLQLQREGNSSACQCSSCTAKSLSLQRKEHQSIGDRHLLSSRKSEDSVNIQRQLDSNGHSSSCFCTNCTGGNPQIQRQTKQVLSIQQSQGIIQRSDQRAGVQRPTAEQITKIQNELNPSTQIPAGETEVPAWDGAADADGNLSNQALKNREALKVSVKLAMTRHLKNATLNVVRPKKEQPKLPMVSFEGAGQAAKQTVDNVFSEWSTHSALTEPQRHARNAHEFKGSGPNQTLFDATDPEQRQLGNNPINISDVANWIFSSDAASQAAQVKHHFNPLLSNEESNFMQTEIVEPFIAAYPRLLEQYDLYGFALADQGTGKIVAAPQINQQNQQNFGDEGAANLAKWTMWKTLVHEYVHTLEHPVSSIASGSNRVIKEGFCEMFTQMALMPRLASIDNSLMQMVEGDTYGDYGIDDYISSYNTPPTYVEYLQGAEAIRALVGDNAVKAAYFQGHVEYIGLKPNGTMADPASEDNVNLITVPAGIPTLVDLVKAILWNATAEEIIAYNSNKGIVITEEAELPPQLYVPNCRDHQVIEVTDAGGNVKAETKEQIAAQNNIDADDLETANPKVDWDRLTSGQHILIPINSFY